MPPDVVKGPGVPAHPPASEGLSLLGWHRVLFTPGQTWFDQREALMIDDSTTYLQPQQSGLALLLCYACMCVSVCVCVQICLAVTVNTLFLREDKEFGSLCRGVCAYGTESHAEVAAPVVRLLFARQRFPSIVQATSPLYPEFVKESSKCHRFAFTPTGFLSCGSNQHWEVASMPRCPSQKLSTLLFFYYFLFFFFFPKCHLSCSSPIVFLRQTTIKAPMFFHY